MLSGIKHYFTSADGQRIVSLRYGELVVDITPTKISIEGHSDFEKNDFARLAGLIAEIRAYMKLRSSELAVEYINDAVREATEGTGE